jgi:hypothetical protein
MNLKELIDIDQYSLNKSIKQTVLFNLLNKLHGHHLNNCQEYEKIANTVFSKHNNNLTKLEDFPFLPVSMFKNHLIKSIPENQVFKILTSSGTTGQQVSKIYLDKETSKLQTLALSKIISHVIGNQRLPMLIIDSISIFSNKSSFSARGAGILGLSVFGKDHTYILNDQFLPDEELLGSFLEKYSGKPILIFGFTFMVWLYFFNSNYKKKYDLSQATLIHSGGWKKLSEMEVDNNTFKKSLFDKFGLTKIYNFYGMVEQVGSVFLENNIGTLQCPNFADIIIRNPVDFSVQKRGEPGLIQVISTLPFSYPGFSLLTEDIGVLTGEDDIKTGWMGKHFKILGRAKKAELRGCSDTFNLIK